MNRSSSRKVKLTSKFEEFKLTANGKKRGRPRKSWPVDETRVDPRPSMPTGLNTTVSTLMPSSQRDDTLRSREENHAKPVGPKPMSSRREELLRLREENTNMKAELERKSAEYEELKRQTSYTGQTVPKVDFDDLKERYNRDLTHAKKNEWCVVCLAPSRYYCCWNTTYCSQKCQVSDWYARHGKSENCERRKAYKLQNATT